MPRIVPCPGSKGLHEKYSSGEKRSEAKEGNVAHAIAAEVISTGKPLSSFIGTTQNNIFIDQEMVHHISRYTEECLGYNIQGTTEAEMVNGYEEHTLTGTPDHWQFDPTQGILRILDLKYGFLQVEVYMNWQLLVYAVLVWEHILRKQPGNFKIFKTIELIIVQPRANHPAGPVRKWSFDADLIRNYRNEIIDAMNVAAQDPSTIRTGDHCRYCNALLRCHGAGAAAAAALEYTGTVVVGDMTPEALAFEMDMVDRAGTMLKQRRTALEEMGLMLCKKGKQLNGWQARSAMGSLAWNVDDAIGIGKAMKADLSQPAKPITPTQAIDRKILTEKQVKALASRSLGAPKLKRIDNAIAKRILSQ